jgi:Cof subfamily protein (haloacid dehalogenase superfamily)
MTVDHSEARGRHSRFRALVLDLDGTLVADDGQVRPRVRAALAGLLERGLCVQIATGRSEGGTREIARSLGLRVPCTVYNGAGLWCPQSDELLEERVLSNRAVERTLDFARRLGLQCVVMQRGRKYASQPRNITEARALSRLEDLIEVPFEDLPREYVIRITLFSPQHATATEFSAQVRQALSVPVYLTEFPLNLLATHRDSPLQVVDVQPPCRGKGEALRYLEETYGIHPQEVVAVGDAGNDVPMLKRAGLGVAMGGSQPEVLAVAKRTIGSCNSDAIAELIAEVFI